MRRYSNMTIDFLNAPETLTLKKGVYMESKREEPVFYGKTIGELLTLSMKKVNATRENELLKYLSRDNVHRIIGPTFQTLMLKGKLELSTLLKRCILDPAFPRIYPSPNVGVRRGKNKDRVLTDVMKTLLLEASKSDPTIMKNISSILNPRTIMDIKNDLIKEIKKLNEGSDTSQAYKFFLELREYIAFSKLSCPSTNS